MARRGTPEGLDRCDPAAIRQAILLAEAAGLRPAVRYLRAVDGGRAVMVVNGPDMAPPTPPRPRRTRSDQAEQ
jgi:hypothetical protein